MNVLNKQTTLQRQSAKLLQQTNLLTLLTELGNPIQTGSSATGLMAYPDIDFNVQSERPDFSKAVALVPRLISDLKATSVKVADFKTSQSESASYYIGFEFPFEKETWHIDATVTEPGPIGTDPPELQSWIENMTEEQRKTILELKHGLLSANRYAGSRSQPPYTFRSSHLYEAVIIGKATSIADIEAYFKT